MLSLFLAENSTNSNVLTYILLAVLVVAIVAMFIISSKRNKKRQQDAQDLMNAVRPGHKVKTIGGICGIVVEVNDEENTFVLETGSEASGKSYMKFDKQAIYQTDAVVEKKTDKKEEKSEEPFEEQTAVEEPAKEQAEKPAEETNESKEN
jgi:preprotein translocase subunit YajC